MRFKKTKIVVINILLLINKANSQENKRNYAIAR